MVKKEEKDLIEFKRKIRKLNTYSKIQDFINSIPVNFEEDGKDSCMSPLSVLEKNKCHCIEGAFLAASIIWLNKLGRPLVIDLRGEKWDWDHVIAVFQDKKTRKYGCISKTNHAVLRYREPVYYSIHELVMSYFHEYTDDKRKGIKTLREYSDPIDISLFGKDWIISKQDLWEIHDFLDKIKHNKILTKERRSARNYIMVIGGRDQADRLLPEKEAN